MRCGRCCPRRRASAITRYAAWRRRPLGETASFPDVDAPATRAIADAALTRGGGWLAPADTQTLLRAVGIRTLRARDVRDVADAAQAARDIGGSIALKAIGPTILHKSDVGGVRLLRGFRGAPAADEAALRDVLLRLSALLDLVPEISGAGHQPAARVVRRNDRG